MARRWMIVAMAALACWMAAPASRADEEAPPPPGSIHRAVYDRNLTRLRTMLREDRKRANQQDKLGWTPLYWAVVVGFSDGVRLLTEAGADVNLRNRRGRTPLHVAVYKVDDRSVRLLLMKNASVRAVTTGEMQPKTPLDVARDVLRYDAAWWAKTGKRRAVGEEILRLLEAAQQKQ
jgi:hypothetical protein